MTFTQNHTQDSNIETNQNIVNSPFGCNCSISFIGLEELKESLSYIFKKLFEIFSCGNKTTQQADGNVLTNVKYLI